MKKRLLLCAVLITFFAKPAFSQWVPGGIPVCIDPERQAHPHIITDDAGGAIIVWRHWYRDNGHFYLVHRAQRIAPNRTLLWGDHGALVFPEMSSSTLCGVIPDGAGGAISVFTVYSESDDYNIHAQRIDENGNALWSSDGVAVCTAARSQTKPRCVSDGSGGAIIVWEDDRSYIEQTYAQRVSGDGVYLWLEDGIDISQSNRGRSPMIAEDGSGGAIIVYEDFSIFTDWDIYMQRVGPDGAFNWADDAVPVCTEVDRQIDPRIISDGIHGGIVVWEDWRDGYEYPCIYAQKVNHNGKIRWGAGGEIVGTMAYYYSGNFEIISDGSGGAIVTWVKVTGAADANIYAQRISSDGDILWDPDGVIVGDMTGDQFRPAIVADGNGGAIIVWRDSSTLDWELYAQRLDENGNTLWAASGISLCCKAQFGGSEPAIATNGDGGIIAAWADVRNLYVNDYDIYAQRIDADGEINVTSDSPPSSNRLLANYPNPFNPTTTIRFHLYERSDVRIDIYDVNGAHVTRLASGAYEQGMHSVPWDGCTKDGRKVNSGIYFSRLTVGGSVLSRKMVLLR